jgi:hypothetical protein
VFGRKFSFGVKTATVLLITFASAFLLLGSQPTYAHGAPIVKESPQFWIDVQPNKTTAKAGDSITYRATVNAAPGFNRSIHFVFTATALGIDIGIDLGTQNPPFPKSFEYNVQIPQVAPAGLAVKGALTGTSDGESAEEDVEITIASSGTVSALEGLFVTLIQGLRDAVNKMTGPSTIWIPTVGDALASCLLMIGLTSVVSSLASIVDDPDGLMNQKLAKKVYDLIPNIIKKWLAVFILSKHKMTVEPKMSSPFTLTKKEALSFGIAVAIMTIAYSYVKSESLLQIIYFIPLILATNIIIEFITETAMKAVARSQGVWGEYRLWFYGLSLFSLSTVAFRAPFSSPKRICYHSPKFTKRSHGLVSMTAIIVPLALSAVFYTLLINGLTLVGNMGLIICLTMAFLDSLPIPPLKGKDVYDWSKALWVIIFEISSVLYMLALLVL